MNDDETAAARKTEPRRSIADQGPRGDDPPRRRGLMWLREVAIVLISAIVIMSLLRAFVGQLYVIPSGSMQNTLGIGDRVVALKITGVSRGDVVVFADSARWLGSDPPERPWWRAALETVGVLPDTSENYLVKRVIGMPGDRVHCCDSQGRLTVNGVALDESSYLYRDATGRQVAPSDFPFDVTVPAGRIFVMGDHRNASADSRCHLSSMGIDAFPSLSKVVGVVWITVLPVTRWSHISRPASFNAIPAAPEPAPAQPSISPAGVHC